MHYSYEYKRKCVELYREGRWPETPDGITDYIDYYNNEQVILEKEGVNKVNKTRSAKYVDISPKQKS